MAKAGYMTSTGANVALTTVAKTVLCVIAPAQFGIDLKKIRVSFDGVSAAGVPILVQLMTSTLATNSTPGTNNTTGTVTQVYGRTITAGFTSFYASTTEPTVLTEIDQWLLSPNGGTILYDYPLGDTPDTAVSNGLVLRMTPPAAVNCRAAMWFERC
jgi:hypothetical protein